jgi:hypothetical protein
VPSSSLLPRSRFSTLNHLLLHGQPPSLLFHRRPSSSSARARTGASPGRRFSRLRRGQCMARRSAPPEVCVRGRCGPHASEKSSPGHGVGGARRRLSRASSPWGLAGRAWLMRRRARLGIRAWWGRRSLHVGKEEACSPVRRVVEGVHKAYIGAPATTAGGAEPPERMTTARSEWGWNLRRGAQERGFCANKGIMVFLLRPW